MKATVLSFRRGRHNQKTNQLLLAVKGIDSVPLAVGLIGRKVAWKTKSGKLVIGKVVAPHGKKGVLRSRFRQGMPGEVLGQEIEIAD